MPVSASVPVPVLTSDPPAPSTMPDTVVERLFEPVVSDFAPSAEAPRALDRAEARAGQE